MRERLSTSCTKDLIGRIWSESLPESEGAGVVVVVISDEGMVVVVDVDVDTDVDVDVDTDVDVDVDTDVCGGMDSTDGEIGDDLYSLPKSKGCKDLITALADWAGGGKKTPGISWVRHTSDKVLTA